MTSFVFTSMDASTWCRSFFFWGKFLKLALFSSFQPVEEILHWCHFSELILEEWLPWKPRKMLFSFNYQDMFNSWISIIHSFSLSHTINSQGHSLWKMEMTLGGHRSKSPVEHCQIWKSANLCFYFRKFFVMNNTVNMIESDKLYIIRKLGKYSIFWY